MGQCAGRVIMFLAQGTVSVVHVSQLDSRYGLVKAAGRNQVHRDNSLSIGLTILGSNYQGR